MGRVGPYSRADEVRVPGDSRNNSDLVWSAGENQWLQAHTDRDQKEDFVQVEAVEQRAVEEGEGYGGRDGVFDMSLRM